MKPGELHTGIAAQDGLPSWAVVTPKRAAHVERVVELLTLWATGLRLDAETVKQWRRAGWLHDALRNAEIDHILRWVPVTVGTVAMLHGPAAAERARYEGESDLEVLDAIRWHTIGWEGWRQLGKALYCADFLEPGRTFAKKKRAALAATFVEDSDWVVKNVVELRISYALEDGKRISGQTLSFQRSLR